MTPTSIFLAETRKLIMAEESYPYKPPRIAKPKDGDLSKQWFVEYYVWDYTAKRLKRKRIVLSQPTKKLRIAEGEKISKEILEVLVNGAYINGPAPKDEKSKEGPRTLDGLLDEYLDYLKIYAEFSTWRTRRTHIRTLKKYLTGLGLIETIMPEEVDKIMVNRFAVALLEQYELSNRGRNNTILELATVFNKFVSDGIIDKNPFTGIRSLPAPAKKHTAFRPYQVHAFKQAAVKDPQLWLAVQFIYYTAIRPRKELRLLRVRDILPSTIVINWKTAKAKRTDHIRIPEEFQKVLEASGVRKFDMEYYVFGEDGQPGPKPLGEKNLYDRHTKILKEIKADGMDIDFYSWKHTGAIALWEATQDMYLIKEHMRHTSLSATIKYLRDLGIFVDYGKIHRFPKI
ncbi:phage integrase SAM-like domain-containing protein [Marinilongibacter aquaticus]|uniref:tyrosine-type recombinase/integrase n=1 Tax=Marinilongibacter aquaticus TaxID=2975157 RepID=UPI0021BD51C8|nr:site-specific integrase [Marinilongibacter aquaticus]UBM58207.1 phage integrase SAM-like domain-containing protein [Marinilongibacter aquaticus]